MSPDQVMVIFERVAYRMVVAGWLKRYCFVAGTGHRVSWTAEGGQKAMLLKDLSEKYDLAGSDNAPLHFHMACSGLPLPLDVTFPPLDIEVPAFWLLCVDELGLADDADGLLGMVHLVTSWGPGLIPP